MGWEQGSAGHDPLDGDERLVDYFGAAWPAVSCFADLLRTHGEEQGLLGPREAVRLWERHVLNSAALVPFVAGARSIIDLGSGAGLPGVVVAAMLPLTEVTLLEPKMRRVRWLNEVAEELHLANVRVVRGRAEEMVGQIRAEVVVARAVGSLSQLYHWGVPLLERSGRLVALKGERATSEVEEGDDVAAKLGLVRVEVCAASTIDGIESTTVVVARRAKNGD